MAVLRSGVVRVGIVLLLVAAPVGGSLASGTGSRAVRSSVRSTDGAIVTAANHPLSDATSGSYLVVWTGDRNATDRPAAAGGPLEADLPGPDFLAVIDADPSSPTYGKVVNSVAIEGPDGFANEPHHLQYSWRPGDRVFAGGLFSDRTFVFDVDDIPIVRLAGVVQPLDTPCGSVPDAYWVLDDGTAFGTYMGGPNAAGDPRCNGGINNGFAGTPGEIVRIDRDGRVLGEFSAAGDLVVPIPNDVGRPDRCISNPQLARASCANPHGIQAREDLGVLITSDYAEPRNVPVDPLRAPDPNVFRDTVRVWDIRDRDRPRIRSVSVMPLGSMAFAPPEPVDARGVMGIMETTVTNLPGHRGAFASSMCGGLVYYSADITAQNPMWREVFDARTAAASILGDDGAATIGGCAGAGWLQTSPDDTVLFQAVIGRKPGTLGPDDPGMPKMVYALDIRDLVAVPPGSWVPDGPDVCAIDTEPEVRGGGAEESCPALAGVSLVPDDTSGGPHWGTIDGFTVDPSPGRLTQVTRVASSQYFVARSGLDGNHTVCVLDVAADGSMSLDTAFRDENTGEVCVDFDRQEWPHGVTGPGKPHSMLFVQAG